jgi:hypothetical protein
LFLNVSFLFFKFFFLFLNVSRETIYEQFVNIKGFSKKLLTNNKKHGIMILVRESKPHNRAKRNAINTDQAKVTEQRAAGESKKQTKSGKTVRNAYQTQQRSELLQKREQCLPDKI